MPLFLPPLAFSADSMWLWEDLTSPWQLLNEELVGGLVLQPSLWLWFSVARKLVSLLCLIAIWFDGHVSLVTTTVAYEGWSNRRHALQNLSVFLEQLGKSPIRKHFAFVLFLLLSFIALFLFLCLLHYRRLRRIPGLRVWNWICVTVHLTVAYRRFSIDPIWRKRSTL